MRSQLASADSGGSRVMVCAFDMPCLQHTSLRACKDFTFHILFSILHKNRTAPTLSLALSAWGLAIHFGKDGLLQFSTVRTISGGWNPTAPSSKFLTLRTYWRKRLEYSSNSHFPRSCKLRSLMVRRTFQRQVALFHGRGCTGDPRRR